MGIPLRWPSADLRGGGAERPWCRITKGRPNNPALAGAGLCGPEGIDYLDPGRSKRTTRLFFFLVGGIECGSLWGGKLKNPRNICSNLRCEHFLSEFFDTARSAMLLKKTSCGIAKNRVTGPLNDGTRAPTPKKRRSQFFFGEIVYPSEMNKNMYVYLLYICSCHTS